MYFLFAKVYFSMNVIIALKLILNAILDLCKFSVIFVNFMLVVL